MRVFSLNQNRAPRPASFNRGRAGAHAPSHSSRGACPERRASANEDASKTPRASAQALKPASGVAAALNSASSGFGHDLSSVPVRHHAAVRTVSALRRRGDEFEPEAESVTLTLTHAPLIRRSCSCGGGCPDCRESPAVSEGVREVLRSHGAPLDSETRGFMESRFGHDFSRVRVHTDAQAAGSARALGASAFTVGTHVVFDAGRYAPRTERGRFLLAHELAHVVQQGGRDDATPATFGIQPADAPWEREADLIAKQVARGDSPARDDAAGEADPKRPGPVTPARRWHSSLMRLPAGALQRQCQETNHPTSPNHLLVELWYKLMFYPTHRLQREFAIPGAAAGGGLGYADLVSSTTHEIWEIISQNQHAEDIVTREGQEIPGRRQDASRYVDWANVSCPTRPPWTLGMTLPAQSIPPQRPLLRVTPEGPGVLKFRPQQREPERVLRGIRWARRELARMYGETMPEPALDRAEGTQESTPDMPGAGQPASPRPARPPVLVELDPELAAYRDAAERVLQSPNLPAADSYLLLAPPDFYEERVRAPRRAAADAAVRGAYEVQGTRGRVNPAMGAHAMAVSVGSLLAALTAAGVAAVTLGPSALVMLEGGLATALQGLTSAGAGVTLAARALLAAMRSPRVAAVSAGAVMYIATFREAQATPTAARGAEQDDVLESLRVVTFAPEGSVRITHRSQSAAQSGVHAFYMGEHYLVAGRARRPSDSAAESEPAQ